MEQFDFREGGRYVLRLMPTGEADHDCSGGANEDSVCAGQFIDIVDNERIVMTSNWIENTADIGETILTIELKPDKGGTDLVLTHEHLPDEPLRRAHQSGWEGSLECLQDYLTIAD